MTTPPPPASSAESTRPRNPASARGAESHGKGLSFEQNFATAMQSNLGFSSVAHRQRLLGAKTQYECDILGSFVQGRDRIEVFVECRNRKIKISTSQIHDLVGIRKDIRAGKQHRIDESWLISPVGFQQSALRVATSEGIHCVLFSPETQEVTLLNPSVPTKTPLARLAATHHAPLTPRPSPRAPLRNIALGLTAIVTLLLVAVATCSNTDESPTSAEKSLPEWYCVCYDEIESSPATPQTLTACRPSRDECIALEKKLRRQTKKYNFNRESRSCQYSGKRHPMDLLGGSGKWEHSDRAGAWVLPGQCLLP